MTYAAKQDMIDRYGEQPLIELTDRETPLTGAIVDDVLDRALFDADALIDSYIARRYDLPLAATPGVLIQHAAAIAYHSLHRGRYPEEVRTAFEDAMKFLTALSSGAAVLDVGGDEPQSAPADARVEGPERIFSREEMKGW